MSIYDADGAALLTAYDADGNSLPNAYDADGNLIFSAFPDWDDEITVVKNRDTATGTAYYVVTIPQTRANGEKQYPFVYIPTGAGDADDSTSTLDMVRRDGWFMGINAGYGDAFASGGTSNKACGITIQNSTIITNYGTYFNTYYTLAINGSGTLYYANPMSTGVTAQDVLNTGAVSAVLGSVPLVINGQASEVPSTLWDTTERAQRQVFGQFPNGDYCVLTCEGRNFDSSPGFTFQELRSLCVSLGLKYAHALDGGGSVETVIGDEQINTIYEGTTGRRIISFIVFNGTDTFFVPNA